VQNTNGIFYGKTENGGTAGDGVFYSFNEGLRPFATFLPAQSAGKEGAKIGILGQGFTSSSVVKFGGVQATAVTLSGSTFLTATVPAGALTGSVTVTTGTTTLTSPQTFKVLPTIKSFSPTSGPVGTSVTITGTGLKQATKVTFDGKSATFTVISDTEVTADVPTGAATGKITVTTKGGSATSTTSFTVN
jgi:large repetitive protein